MPARVDEAAYRLAQEALTNAVRHADARRIGVTVSRDGAGLTVLVEDDGATVPPPSFVPGRGLAGMRERARLLGGELSVTPAKPHGWRVSATLPEAAA